MKNKTDDIKLAYRTKLGKCYQGKIERAIRSKKFVDYKGKINLIFTSPPFPLNRAKKYGNLNGKDYVNWLTNITTKLKEYLANDGSLVIEIGNAWEKGEPVMSTFPVETLLAIKNKGEYKLCQQFIWFNTARLPSPTQWVNVERIRVKDSFTTIWWLSKSSRPKANNMNVLEEYSDSMKKLLKNRKYNYGLRPSEHLIGEESFLKNNNGAIPSNVLIGANTQSFSPYIDFCKKKKLELHPARMPEFLVGFFVKFLTQENDIVLDPFSGSNTTGFVAEYLSRKWIAIESNKKYIVGSKGRFINKIIT